MYFEDLYFDILERWAKKEFRLSKKDLRQDYIISVKKYYVKLEVEFESDSTSWWQEAMAYTFYQVYTEWGIMKLRLGEKKMNINEIPVFLISGKFYFNIKDNEVYFNEYKGVRNSEKYN